MEERREADLDVLQPFVRAVLQQLADGALDGGLRLQDRQRDREAVR